MNKRVFSFSNILYYLLLAGLLAVAFVPGAKSWGIQQLMKIGLFQPGVPAGKEAAAAAPEMFFRDATGTPVALSALKGKVVFINFWATWCPPCRAEMPAVNSLYMRWRHHPDLVFLMVDADGDLTRAAKFMTDNGYQLPVAMSAGSVPDSVYAGTLPTTLIIDKAGRIVFRKTGAADYSNTRLQEYLGQLLADKP